MITAPPPSNLSSSTSNGTQIVQQTNASDPQLQEVTKESVNAQVRAIVLAKYLEKQIKKNESYKVVTDVSVIDLQSNQPIESHNLDTEQFAASVNKLPIAQLVLNDLRSGKLKLNQTITWKATDVRAGAGVYDQPGAPTSATVQQLLFDMLNPSGNTAVRAFVNYPLGGGAAVNQRFKTELGLSHTYLQILDPTSFYVGYTTARESIAVIQKLLSVDDSYTTLVKNALATNIYVDYGVRSQLAGNDYVVLANKVGILDDPEGNNRHDVGIVYNTKSKKSYGYSFLTTAPGQAYNTPTAQAGISLADMGRGVLRFAGDKPTDTARGLSGRPITPEKRVRY